MDVADVKASTTSTELWGEILKRFQLKIRLHFYCNLVILDSAVFGAHCDYELNMAVVNWRICSARGRVCSFIPDVVAQPPENGRAGGLGDYFFPVSLQTDVTVAGSGGLSFPAIAGWL